MTETALLSVAAVGIALLGFGALVLAHALIVKPNHPYQEDPQ